MVARGLPIRQGVPAHELRWHAARCGWGARRQPSGGAGALRVHRAGGRGARSQRGCGDRVPLRRGLRTEAPKRAAREQMTPDAESVVDGGVNRHGALGDAGDLNRCILRSRQRTRACKIVGGDHAAAGSSAPSFAGRKCG